MSNVSVIIPTHNRDEFLPDAVRSFAIQSLPVKEIIVVDDAESQWTEERLISQLSSDSRQVSVFVFKNPDQGASSSRNLGANRATGDILCFLDDDDIVDENYILKMIGCLNEGCDVSVCWTLSKTGDVISPRKKTTIHHEGSDPMNRLSGVTGSNFMIRREAFEKVGGFDPDLYCYNDKDLFLRLIEAGCHFGVVEEGLVTMRQHSGSRLTTVNEKRIVGLRDFFEKHKEKMSASQKESFETKILLNQYFVERSLGTLLRLFVRSFNEGKLRHHFHLIRQRNRTGKEQLRD